MAAHQTYPPSCLYIVATPIGNRADITLRGIYTLSIMDAIACEDTRTSGLWLQSMGLQKQLLAIHEHNEQAAAQSILHRLAQGQRIAYISDAGTPAISDPGAVLVNSVRQAGYRCIPIPGASSTVTALSVAGDTNASEFIFIGFLPAKGAARSKAMQICAQEPRTQIILEAPHRLESLLKELAPACGDRTITIARELTKQYESIYTLSAHEALSWIQNHENHLKGEFVLILHQQAKTHSDSFLSPEIEHLLTCLLSELPLKQAVSLTTRISGLARNDIYALALSLKNNLPTSD